VRCLWILAVLSPIASYADKQVSNEFALALQKAGYAIPTRMVDSPAIRVVTAFKQGKQQLVYATPDGAPKFAMVAGEIIPADHTLTIKSGTAFGKLDGIVELHLEVEQKRPNDAYTRDGKTLLLRTANAEVACVVLADETTDPGKACGSGGWRNVTVKVVPGTAQPTFEVTTVQSGNFSRRTANGQCQPASPVRPRPVVTRVVIPPTGACTQTAAPTP
jgi:hypothetical protein